MRTQEKLIYTNERGESIEFSPASSYHVNFKDVTGLSDVRYLQHQQHGAGRRHILGLSDRKPRY